MVLQNSAKEKLFDQANFEDVPDEGEARPEQQLAGGKFSLADGSGGLPGYQVEAS